MKKSTKAVLLVGSPAQVPDIRYVTGFDAPDPVVVLKARGCGHLAVPAMEVARARRVARGWRVWAWNELCGKARPCSLHELAAALLRRAGARKAVVPVDFPIGVADALRAGGTHIEVCDARLFPERAVKSRAEVGSIRRAQKAAGAGLERALAVLKAASVARDGALVWRRQPLTSEILKTEIHQVLLSNGCAGFETIASCGRASADPHERGSGRLFARQPIVLDIFPRDIAGGYYGDLTRTVVKGQPPPMLAKMYDAVKEAQAAALAAVRARAQCKSVHEAACMVFKRRGFQTDITSAKPKGFIHSTGHGVGLEVHEAPSISSRPGLLKSGNVITIEPGLYYPEIGGVRIEDTVEVVQGGWRKIWNVNEAFIL